MRKKKLWRGKEVVDQDTWKIFADDSNMFIGKNIVTFQDFIDLFVPGVEDERLREDAFFLKSYIRDDWYEELCQAMIKAGVTPRKKARRIDQKTRNEIDRMGMETAYNFFEFFKGKKSKRNYSVKNFYPTFKEMEWDISKQRNRIESFAFRVRKDSDALQSYKINGKLYSRIELTLEKEKRSWKEQNLEYLHKAIKYVENAPNDDHLSIFLFDKRWMTCKERPYRLYMAGCDDSSYTKACATLEEAQGILEFIKRHSRALDTYAFVNALGFVFTN